MKESSRVLLSVREDDKDRMVGLVTKLLKYSFELDATNSIATILDEIGINLYLVNKVHDGKVHEERPYI